MFKKITLTLLFVMCISLSGRCYSDEQLANVEIMNYGQTFENDSLSSRLIRLENDLFGMAQSGDIDSRLDLISQMSANSKTASNLTPYDNYYPGEKKGGLKNIWNNISSGFSSGSVTGFTPSINSYGFSNDLYRNGLWNMFNGANQYCPYHNSYHTNNNMFHNSFEHHHPMGYHRHSFRPSMPRYTGSRRVIPDYTNFNAQYVNPYNYYNNRIPTNYNTDVTTRSTVHILKD